MRRAARYLAISSKKSLCALKKKRKLRGEIVDVHAAAHAPFDVFDAVAQGERQFLNGGGAGFANVIAADGDGIEFRRVLRAELERVDHQPHGRLGRIDVFLLRDVFLEDVVLQRAGEFLPVGALLFGDGQIHGPDDGGGRIDGHRGGDVGERNLVEEHFHVGERADGHAALADFAFGRADGRSRSPSEWADRRRRRGRSGLARADSGSARWCLRRCRSRRTGAWSRGGRGTWWSGCRGCRAARRASPRSRSEFQSGKIGLRCRGGGSDSRRRW